MFWHVAVLVSVTCMYPGGTKRRQNPGSWKGVPMVRGGLDSRAMWKGCAGGQTAQQGKRDREMKGRNAGGGVNQSEIYANPPHGNM